MPTALHPQAKFDPIPPDLDLHSLVDQTPNFDWVVRISISQIRRLGSSGFEKLVQLHVIEGGRPLVIEGWNKVLPDSLFSAKWLEQAYDKKQENVRDLGSQADVPMTMGHYLRSMRQLSNQWSPTNYRDERRQRLYLKDIDCPPEWYDHLRKVIPPNVFYMNDNVSDNVGVDARHDDDIFGAPEPTAAVAGDLMSCLPEDMRAQNLMCYIGHEGTYTPAHREMCGSLGQNIMVEASGDANGEKPGSSIWFMTETKDREVVREYFLSMLGHDVEIEKHFAQINAWKKANFPVYIVEQKVGDFILVPPLAPHQVWNRGTRTMKVAWNRTTVETLGLALHEALPRTRLVCRDEQYKNKSMIYFALDKYHKELQIAEDSADSGLLGLGRELTNSPRIKQIAADFRQLFELFTEVLIDEMFGHKQMDIEFIEFDSNITCSYCRSNIFNRFLTCKCCVRTLVNGDEDTYDICMECYVMGRSCVCISGLQWCEQWRWSHLVDKHETWRAMVIKQDGFVDIDSSPQPIEIARKKSRKRSVAELCQEQLRRRPWNDITKPPEEAAPYESEPEPEVDDEGRVKKKPKPKRKVKKGDTYRCHVCCHKDYRYRLSFCKTCQEAYCYGVLFRAFDTMPQAAMEQEHWQCPRCLGICNCGSCRRAGNTKPYVPKSTLLGHDTRKVADDRSVESVVDFRIHNLNWLKGTGEETRSKNSKRMQRLMEQAEAEKAKDPLAALDAAEDAPHEVLPESYGQDGMASGAAGETQIGETAENRASVADMTGIENDEGDSAYPDPTAYPSPQTGGRMMGMGFYEQDDSADRILFDAFQIPSADALNNEPEVSEFVKKTLRMAKRRARLETDDDPDFQGPKSHHRKKPKTGNIDQLVNLDPALLGNLGNPSDSTTGTPIRADAQPRSSEGSAAPEGVTEQSDADTNQPKTRPIRAPLPIDPLRPQLRHAKPAQSYVEAEEPGEEPEDLLAVDSIKLFGTEKEVEMTKDPIDLAADAIRALTGQGTPPDANSTPKEGVKKRGRPPGRPPRSSLPGNTPASATKGGKKRGRPPGKGKPRQPATDDVDGSEDVVMADAVQEDTADSLLDELEAQLEADMAKEGDSEPASRLPLLREPAPKRRGRPPGRKSMPASLPEPEPVQTPAPVHSFMSMAERMAARGKKFKIRARTSSGTASSPALASTPKSVAKKQDTTQKPSKEETRRAVSDTAPKRGRQELVDDEFNDPQAEASDSVSSDDDSAVRRQTLDPKPRGRPPGRPAMRPAVETSGPTVVRLDLSDGFGSSDSDSDSDDDDEEGIPATPKYTAVRGGRGRGRPGRPAGLGRGRGGRGRGRGRG
ncbi:uncharacterized protein JN550_006012 [Neoarthrinium moseri]|uniref:uncharacterized protein n=1 Tax=Neoarthrinium moseri TaxID=1658444 RepID=UPI001FDE459E|nr:uncharacterized protein JN550_006012 [Neoarthrinium moseri]KAI1869025.1 hypothetical protein JN550_006012 [Neoarthrinium moseri]